MTDLVRGFDAAVGRILVCELTLEIEDLTAADLREGVEVVGVSAFLVESEGASRTFCFWLPVWARLGQIGRDWASREPQVR